MLFHLADGGCELVRKRVPHHGPDFVNCLAFAFRLVVDSAGLKFASWGSEVRDISATKRALNDFGFVEASGTTSTRKYCFASFTENRGGGVQGCPSAAQRPLLSDRWTALDHASAITETGADPRSLKMKSHALSGGLVALITIQCWLGGLECFIYHHSPCSLARSFERRRRNIAVRIDLFGCFISDSKSLLLRRKTTFLGYERNSLI